MPPRKPEDRLGDIIMAIRTIRTYVQSVSQADFDQGGMVYDAVVRNLSIVGEAAARLPESFTTQYPDMPWAEMRALRNVLVHEYFSLISSLLWKTIHDELFPLLPSLEEILEQTREARLL